MNDPLKLSHMIKNSRREESGHQVSVSCSFQSNLSARCWKFPQTLKYLIHFKYRPPKPKYQPRAQTLSTSAKTCPNAGASFTAPGDVRESECLCVHVATCKQLYMYTLVGSNRVIQHVSRILTGGSVSSSSGGIWADDVVLWPYLFFFICFFF